MKFLLDLEHSRQTLDMGYHVERKSHGNGTNIESIVGIGRDLDGDGNNHHFPWEIIRPSVTAVCIIAEFGGANLRAEITYDTGPPIPSVRHTLALYYY